MTMELLRTRAERGHPRGAAAVWVDANRQSTEQARPSDSSATPFRFAVAAAALLLAGSTAALLTEAPVGDLPIVTDLAGNDEVDADEASLDGPVPILIEGMTLDAVTRPVDVRGDCAERPVGDVDPETGAPVSNRCRERSFAVFAEPGQPFAGTIVVLETLPNGSYQLSGINLGEEPLTTFDGGVVQDEIDGENIWTLGPSVGLEEMARFDDTANVQIQAGWDFDYLSDEPARVELQTELDVGGASVWRWVARLAVRHDDDPKIAAPVEVLGTTGVQLDLVGRDETEIIWVSGNRTFRMWADDPDADDLKVIPATPFVERLQIVERTVWQAAVDDASTTTVGEWIAASYKLIGLVALAGISGYFLLRRRWVWAAVAGAAPVVWYVMALGLPLALILFGPGLWVLTSKISRKDRRQPPPQAPSRRH